MPTERFRVVILDPDLHSVCCWLKAVSCVTADTDRDRKLYPQLMSRPDCTLTKLNRKEKPENKIIGLCFGQSDGPGHCLKCDSIN